MNKELEKEAEKYIRMKQTPLTKYDLVAFAEVRENQIQIDATQIVALQKQNGELTDKLTEAKEIIREYVDFPTSNEELWKLHEKAEDFLKE